MACVIRRRKDWSSRLWALYWKAEKGTSNATSLAMRIVMVKTYR